MSCVHRDHSRCLFYLSGNGALMLEDYSDRDHQLITFEIYERSARHRNNQKRAIRFSEVLSSGRFDHRQKTAATEASIGRL